MKIKNISATICSFLALLTVSCGISSGSRSPELEASTLVYQRGGFSSGYTTIVIDFEKGLYQKAHITSPTMGPETILSPAEASKWKDRFKSHGSLMSSKTEQAQLTELRIQLSKVKKWKKNYLNKSILDGESWKIKIIMKDGKIIESSGLNSYPPNWEKISNSIETLCGE